MKGFSRFAVHEGFGDAGAYPVPPGVLPPCTGSGWMPSPALATARLPWGAATTLANGWMTMVAPGPVVAETVLGQRLYKATVYLQVKAPTGTTYFYTCHYYRTTPGPKTVAGVPAGLGDDSDDNPPPIDSMPGSSTSNEAQDTGTNFSSGGDNSGGPALNTNINPNAAVTAGAQSSSSPVQPLPDNSGGGGGTTSTTTSSSGTPSWLPWIIGGAAVAGAGGWYWWKHHRK